MPNVELTAFIENELTNNPLLERAEEREELSRRPPDGESPPPPRTRQPSPATGRERRWRPTPPALAANLGTEVDNAFDPDRTAAGAQIRAPTGRPQLRNSWTGVGGGWDAGEAPDLEAYVAETLSLRDHLQRQAAILLADPAERIIGAALIDASGRGGIFRRLARRDRRPARRQSPGPSKAC